MQLSVRDVEDRTFKEFKAQAVKEGLTVGRALTFAMRHWMEEEEDKKSFLDFRKVNSRSKNNVNPTASTRIKNDESKGDCFKEERSPSSNHRRHHPQDRHAGCDEETGTDGVKQGRRRVAGLAVR